MPVGITQSWSCADSKSFKFCLSMQRRLLIGIAAAAVLGGLSLIPSDTLREKPPKPLFQYLAPLLRIQVCPGDMWSAVCIGFSGTETG